jgi:hypothetical protein
MLRIKFSPQSQSTSLKLACLSSVNVKININNECSLILSKDEKFYLLLRKKSVFSRAREIGRNRMGPLLLMVLMYFLNFQTASSN